MRIGLIDNYDSFTFNLYQYLAEVFGVEPEVIKNNAVSSLSDQDFDAFVISPGPGHPANPRDFGVSASVIRHSRRPILGICLGHQGIVTTHGGVVVHAPEPRHGRTSTIKHDGSALFAGIPEYFDVVRYHSLCAQEPLPQELVVTARTDDGMVMALAHAVRPLWGVEFHPESIYAEYGKQLLRNFRSLVLARAQDQRTMPLVAAKPFAAPAQPKSSWRASHRVIASTAPTDAVFDRLFGVSKRAFWLDSSALRQGLSRFSFMGDDSGPHGYAISYRNGGGVSIQRGDGQHTEQACNVFEFLQSHLQTQLRGHESLPFDFCGGFVGYLGYELKELTHPLNNRFKSSTPDAAFRFVDRFVAYDHHTQRYFAVSVYPEGSAPAPTQAWLDTIETAIGQLAPGATSASTPSGGTVLFTLEAQRPSYLSAIDTSLEAIRDGESYEICLTNRLRATVDLDPLKLYHALRKQNPAPYAALLRFDDFNVLCSSPERFLRVSPNGVVESKPIKGTRPRGSDPASDHALLQDLACNGKDRAENLMITDLVRNDLGQVCQIGSVWTPKLMQVESYATVHQLVSTIRGQLRTDCSLSDLVSASFPGGSMTGAPKLRTLELIDALEHSARGIYSGALGYFSLNGAADLNIVIRTLVQRGSELEIGVGGAIIALSDPADEFAEILVKGRALMQAVAYCATGDAEAFRLIHEGRQETLSTLLAQTQASSVSKYQELPTPAANPHMSVVEGAT